MEYQEQARSYFSLPVFIWTDSRIFKNESHDITFILKYLMLFFCLFFMRDASKNDI